MTLPRFGRPFFLMIVLAFLSSTALPAGGGGAEQMDFGVRAAKKGLWREAQFRWERALKLAPENPRILNNLAVACETAGNFEKAAEYYKEALRLAPENRDIRQNHDLFAGYYKEILAHKEMEAGRDRSPDSPPADSAGTPEPSDPSSSPKASEPEEKPPDASPR
jgi:tetratricopeptide (TPR) repeat protein